MVRVVVVGGTGRTGKAVVRYLTDCREIEVGGVVSRTHAGGKMSNLDKDLPYDIPIFGQVEKAVMAVRPSVLVDFSVHDAAVRHFQICVEQMIHPIIGTTGISKVDQMFMADQCRVNELGGALIPNFALGMLMLQKAMMVVADVFSAAIVIDCYSEQKKEAPSGTSKHLVKLLAKHQNFQEQNVPVQSLRLPGHHVSQQVKFGGHGETLSISHDVSDRICFGPGVAQAILGIHNFRHLVTDLNDLFFQDD